MSINIYLSLYLHIYYEIYLSTKVWPAADLYDKVVNFRTLSPPLANLTSSLASSSVHMSGDQVKYNLKLIKNILKIRMRIFLR